MWQHFLLWLDKTRLTDPLQRQQARIIQIMFLALGARTLLVGIRPEVAQTLVSLGVDLSNIPTYADLQGAIAIFIPQAGEFALPGNPYPTI
jgi:hypothetical protein